MICECGHARVEHNREGCAVVDVLENPYGSDPDLEVADPCDCLRFVAVRETPSLGLVARFLRKHGGVRGRKVSDRAQERRGGSARP